MDTNICVQVKGEWSEYLAVNKQTRQMLIGIFVFMFQIMFQHQSSSTGTHRETLSQQLTFGHKPKVLLFMWLCWDHNALHHPADLNQQVAHFGHDPSSVFNALIWAQGEHCTGEITVLTQTLRILLISSGNYSQVWWGRWTSQTCKLGQRDCENMGKITQTRFCFNNFQKKILNRNRTY